MRLIIKPATVASLYVALRMLVGVAGYHDTTCSLVYNREEDDFMYVCDDGSFNQNGNNNNNGHGDNHGGNDNDENEDQDPSLDFIANPPFETGLFECQGHCRDDRDCAYGLNCYKQKRAVPGCQGKQQRRVDYCYRPPSGELVIWTDGTTNDKGKLDVCEGHCVLDIDCKVGLKCYMRESQDTPVPGCTGKGTNGIAYCINPEGLDFDQNDATSLPTEEPTVSPSSTPTTSPTEPPTSQPTDKPTGSPSADPTSSPTKKPSASPTSHPTPSPISPPTNEPTPQPSETPTTRPTTQPSETPTTRPTTQPSETPTTKPTTTPTGDPTLVPTPNPTISEDVINPDSNPTDIGFGEKPFSQCKGRCHNDLDCLPGLVCFKRTSENMGDNPGGCTGMDGFEWMDYCYQPGSDHVVIVDKPSDGFGECQGSCETDNDCRDALQCFKRVETEPVPGCQGKGVESANYCYAPNHSQPAPTPSPSSESVYSGEPPHVEKLGQCQGRCAQNSDCADGLVCFVKTAQNKNENPGGCSNVGFLWMSYCYDAGDGFTPNNESSPAPVSSQPVASPSEPPPESTPVPTKMPTDGTNSSSEYPTTFMPSASDGNPAPTSLTNHPSPQPTIDNPSPGGSVPNHPSEDSSPAPTTARTHTPEPEPTVSTTSMPTTVSAAGGGDTTMAPAAVSATLIPTLAPAESPNSNNGSFPPAQQSSLVPTSATTKEPTSSEGGSQFPSNGDGTSSTTMPSPSPTWKSIETDSTLVPEPPTTVKTTVPTAQSGSVGGSTSAPIANLSSSPAQSGSTPSPSSAAEPTTSNPSPSAAVTHNPSGVPVSNLTPTPTDDFDQNGGGSSEPTTTPSQRPTDMTTSKKPSSSPTVLPTSQPSVPPSQVPSDSPSSSPTTHPSLSPSETPSRSPTLSPTTAVPTSSPTPDCKVNGKARINEIEATVEWEYIDDPYFPFDDKRSPESLALKWLTKQDSLHLCPDSENVLQRYVLASLYFHLTGDFWTNCTLHLCTGFPFLSGVPECQWEGIVCENNKVKEIHLNARNVTGQLPGAISLLDALEVLVLDDNKISGSLPESFGSLERLRVLDLDNNNLSGSIPESLFNASTIQVLDFDTNQLSGTISTQIGELTGLYFLQLDKNTFDGAIPTELASLSNLKYISLFQNNFTSTIPSALCGGDKQIFADCSVCTIEDCCKACLL